MRAMVIVLFVAVLAVPLILFNTKPNSVSLIDNRNLTENPFTIQGDLTTNIQNYVNDRIGLRDEMINAYTILNDKVFGKMVHPSYTYGKDGYVFGNGLTTGNDFSDFHVVFADMVAKIQAYCTARNVPFLFVFNPAKPAVYQDKIAAGVNYNRDWVALFFAELDKRGVRYLDNTETLSALRENGTDGFNQKYDANHWNDLGAFYGTQAMLAQLQKQLPSVHVNQLDEFGVNERVETSLQVSQFPINEKVPSLAFKTSISSRRDEYSGEIQLHPSHRAFGYHVNNAARVKDTPKALVFQGSYMNAYGYKYLANAFAEYIYVHDYENVMDLPYYFNIFQPECVIFEVAEYTFSNSYFNYENMKKVNYNPVLSQTAHTAVDMQAASVTVEKGKTLTTINWTTAQTYPHVWMNLDTVYDMKRTKGGYQVTVETARYEAAKDTMALYVAE